MIRENTIEAKTVRMFRVHCDLCEFGITATFSSQANAEDAFKPFVVLPTRPLPEMRIDLCDDCLGPISQGRGGSREAILKALAGLRWEGGRRVRA